MLQNFCKFSLLQLVYIGGYISLRENRNNSTRSPLPNHFDKYFAEIASFHKYQTRFPSLQKYYLPRMKTSLGQLSLKYIGPKSWSNIPENLKSSSPYSFGKKYKKVLLSCQTSC